MQVHFYSLLHYQTDWWRCLDLQKDCYLCKVHQEDSFLVSELYSVLYFFLCSRSLQRIYVKEDFRKLSFLDGVKQFLMILDRSELVVRQNSAVIRSLISQSGGNKGPDLSSNSIRCFLSQLYLESSLSSHASSSPTANKMVFFNCN